MIEQILRFHFVPENSFIYGFAGYVLRPARWEITDSGNKE